MTNDVYIHLDRLKKLKSLALARTSFDDKVFKRLEGRMRQLEKVNLEDCEGISLAAYRMLASMKNLRELNVSGLNLTTEEATNILVSCEKLTRLSFKNCAYIDEAGKKLIQEMLQQRKNNA